MTEQFFMMVGVVSMVALIAESSYSYFFKKNWYNFTDLIANLNVGVGQVFTGLIATPMVFFLYNYVEESFSLYTLSEITGGRNFLYFGLSILLVELCQYWGHRTAHERNFFIAGHITHHTSRFFNISTAFRISWFYRMFAWVFFLPLAVMGIPVLDFVLFQVVMNGYNLLMHTQVNPPYGPLKYILLTPEHHRIHHCCNKEYIGKNYGAMFIVFDYLFGTQASKKEGIAYEFGYDHEVKSANPFTLNFHYLRDCYKSVKGRPVALIRLLWSKRYRPANFSHENEDFAGKFSFTFIMTWLLLLSTAMYFTKIKESLSLGEKALVIAFSLLAIFLNYQLFKIKRQKMVSTTEI